MTGVLPRSIKVPLLPTYGRRLPSLLETLVVNNMERSVGVDNARPRQARYQSSWFLTHGRTRRSSNAWSNT